MSRSKTLLFSILFLASVLRLTWLDTVPSSLYTDEADQGYNAYSILRTGRDEHGVFLPVSLRSFGDWKPPLPTYLMIPFIFVFGLNEWSIRLPSALLGIGSVYLTYLLIRALIDKDEGNPLAKERVLPRSLNPIQVDMIALVSALLVSISPWHILQSRSAMLVIIALFFLQLGVLLYLKAKDKPFFIVLASASFVLGVYSYYGMRVALPIVILFLMFFYKKVVLRHIRYSLVGVAVGFVMLLPLLVSFINEPDVVLGRARTISVFYDQGVKLRQWELITQDGMEYVPKLSLFFHNKWYLYGKTILKNFFLHLSATFLFLDGDRAQPFQVPNMGIIYFIDGIFFFTGIGLSMRKGWKFTWLLTVWIGASLVPAAFTFMIPSSNRTFGMVIPIMIFTALGIVFVLQRMKRKVLFVGVVSLLYIAHFQYFAFQYFTILPTEFASWWNYGWKDVVRNVKAREGQYNDIVVLDTNGMPYIYFLLYGNIDPAWYQKNAKRTYVANRFGFEHVSGFGKYYFLTEDEWNIAKENLQSRSLYIVPHSYLPSGNKKILHTVQFPDGASAFQIFAYD